MFLFLPLTSEKSQTKVAVHVLSLALALLQSLGSLYFQMFPVHSALTSNLPSLFLNRWRALLFPFATIANYHFVVSKVQNGLSELKSRCWQGFFVLKGPGEYVFP